MQTRPPSLGRIAVAIGFALSCFGLILFLWTAFGGPIPLKAKSYEITAYFPDAAQLVTESDVRIGGVSVGKVRDLQVAPPEQRVAGEDTTEATLEIEPQFAPISSDARAILRQKTLLGETYVELTSGTNPDTQRQPVSLGAAASVSDAEAQDVHSIPEGGTLSVAQTKNATQIDDIFNAFDKSTRAAFQRWQANAAVAINGRSVDLNDGLGNLGPFVSDATNILSVLRRQKVALRGLVQHTGTVFDALSERNQELAAAITGSESAFGALAREDRALAESVQTLPAFELESRLTLARLDRFQANARPLIQKLLPVANDVSPTLRSVRELSPNLKSLFIDLRPLLRASRKGFPATSRFLGALRPTLDALDPSLANLNPVIRYLGFQKREVTNFLTGPAAGLAGTVTKVAGQPAPRHALRQLSYVSPESLSLYQERLPTNRGNGYLLPRFTTDRRSVAAGIFPNFDCRPSGGQRLAGDGESPPVDVSFAPCIVQRDFPQRLGGKHFPDLFPDR